MEIPTSIVAPPWPMAARPQPPADGETVQIQHYQVSARTCTCCNPPQTRYLVRNCLGEVLSMATDDGWARMCHVLGWYPLPGLAIGERIPNGYDSAQAGGEREGSRLSSASPVSPPAAAVSTTSATAGGGPGTPMVGAPNRPHPESPTPAATDPQIGLFG